MQRSARVPCWSGKLKYFGSDACELVEAPPNLLSAGHCVLNPPAVPGAYRSSMAHDSLMVCSQVGFRNEVKFCAALSY
jgi:hypothetical protein